MQLGSLNRDHQMQLSHWTIVVALSLAAPLQAANPGGTPGAGGTLSTAGNVWTNAVLLPSGTTVHSGDRIETDHGALAILWSPTMGRVEIRSDSEVTLAAGHLRLHRGTVAGSGISVLLERYSVEPVPSEGIDSWFAVSDRDGKQLIAAHRGQVRIVQAGMAPILVPAGSYAVPAGEPDEEEEDNKKAGGKTASRGARGAAAAGGVGGKTAGGFTIGSLSHAASVALIAGAGAAALGGAVAAVTLNDPSPSPSQ